MISIQKHSSTARAKSATYIGLVCILNSGGDRKLICARRRGGGGGGSGGDDAREA